MTDLQLASLIAAIQTGSASLEAIAADVRVVAWLILAGVGLLCGLMIVRLFSLGKNQKTWL